jgi:hypothetical protein
MNLHQKIIGTISVFSILLVLIIGFSSSIFSSVNGLDFDVSDFKCIAPVGNIGDNICSEDNSVTQETNNIDNSVTDNSVDNSDNSQDNDVTISDSFNPSNTCGNNSAEGTFSNNTLTCSIDINSEIAPSTLGLSGIN